MRRRHLHALALAAAVLTAAGCSGGTPLRLALSRIFGTVSAPISVAPGTVLDNAPVRLYRLRTGGDGRIATTTTTTTTSSGTFEMPDIPAGQTVLVEATDTVAGIPNFTVAGLVRVETQTPVSKSLNGATDLAAAAALRLLSQGLVEPSSLTTTFITNLELAGAQLESERGSACFLNPAERSSCIGELLRRTNNGQTPPSSPPSGGVGVIVQ